MFCEYIKWNIIQSDKKKIVPFAAVWMDLEITMLSEESQRERQI